MGAYSGFKDIIQQPITTIVECGARDGLDSIQLAQFFKADTFCFECNPMAIDICRKNLVNYPQIKLIEKAVWDENTSLTFFPINIEKSHDPSFPKGNIGASSCFEYKTPVSREHYVQDKITVEATRLDTFCNSHHIPAIDLLCMDLQGAELNALKGLGHYLTDIKYIISEVTFKEIYDKQPLFEEFDAFLNNHGFFTKIIIKMNEFFGDAVYINKNKGLRWWGSIT